jgi:hypothetical protein
MFAASLSGCWCCAHALSSQGELQCVLLLQELPMLVLMLLVLVLVLMLHPTNQLPRVQVTAAAVQMTAAVVTAAMTLAPALQAA